MVWTDERVATMKTMWGGGASCTQIACALGNGISRNAVIGKVHRLGLSGRVKVTVNTPHRNGGPKRLPRVASVRRVASAPRPIIVPAAAPPVELAAPPDASRVTLAQLEHWHCRFPLGDPREDAFRFCGAAKGDALAYCAYHRQVAYAPAQQRVRRAA